MDHFFEFIVKHKFGIIATALLHVILFFVLNFYYLEIPEKDLNEVTEMEIPLEEISMEDLSQEKKDKEGNIVKSGEIKNTVVDKNDEREKSMENYSPNSMDKKVEEELKNLEKETFDKLKNDKSGEEQNTKSYEHKTDEELERKAKEHLDNKGAEGNKAYAGRAIADFDLKGRKERSIKIPSYTCRGSGTVVVRIKVNNNGEVEKADYASELSYKPSACMIEKAEAYAERSTFNYSTDAENPQIGTITYQFIAQ